jgi:hypothetical protein
MFSDTFPDRFRTGKRNDYLDEDIPDEDDTNATPASPIPSNHHALRHPVQVHLQIRVTPFLRTLSPGGICARRCARAWLVERAWSR